MGSSIVASKKGLAKIGYMSNIHHKRETKIKFRITQAQ